MNAGFTVKEGEEGVQECSDSP